MNRQKRRRRTQQVDYKALDGDGGEGHSDGEGTFAAYDPKQLPARLQQLADAKSHAVAAVSPAARAGGGLGLTSHGGLIAPLLLKHGSVQLAYLAAVPGGTGFVASLLKALPDVRNSQRPHSPPAPLRLDPFCSSVCPRWSTPIAHTSCCKGCQT